MKPSILNLTVGALLLLGANMASAAFLAGDAVSLDTGAGGAVTITPAPAGGPYAAVVGASAEYAVCVDGPTTDGCSSSGLSISIDISDTANAIDFLMSGSTGAGGTFSLELSSLDFTPAGTIVGISPLGYPFSLSGTFGWTGFTGDSITFEGSGVLDLNAIGGLAMHFDIEVLPNETSVPEPGALALLGVALAGMGFARRRSAIR